MPARTIDPAAPALLRTALAAPLYKEALEQYELLRKKLRRHPHWYQLYGGPTSLKQLAVSLGHAGSYEILYGAWSATGHGNDVIRRTLTEADGGGPAARPIRDPREIPTIVNLAINYALDATRLIVLPYRQGEELRYGEWYVREVRERWSAV